MGDFRFERDLVRALLREQHPDLADLELRDVAGGWDNQQFRLGAELPIRLPRTERAPALPAIWILLPEGAASRFFDAYQDADEATIARARGWAVPRALHLIFIGRNGRLGLPGGKPTWGPAGRVALERALATSEN